MGPARPFHHANPVSRRRASMADARPLSGRVAVVTGGSSGIGAAAVRQFADLGADVVIGYHANEKAARELLQSLPAGRHEIARLALEDAATFAALRDMLKSQFRETGHSRQFGGIYPRHPAWRSRGAHRRTVRTNSDRQRPRTLFGHPCTSSVVGRIGRRSCRQCFVDLRLHGIGQQRRLLRRQSRAGQHDDVARARARS